eukprot:6526812-Pyramimonas_sp.AAC.1
MIDRNVDGWGKFAAFTESLKASLDKLLQDLTPPPLPPPPPPPLLLLFLLLLLLHLHLLLHRLPLLARGCGQEQFLPGGAHDWHRGPEGPIGGGGSIGRRRERRRKRRRRRSSEEEEKEDE